MQKMFAKVWTRVKMWLAGLAWPRQASAAVVNLVVDVLPEVIRRLERLHVSLGSRKSQVPELDGVVHLTVRDRLLRPRAASQDSLSKCSGRNELPQSPGPQCVTMQCSEPPCATPPACCRTPRAHPQEPGCAPHKRTLARQNTAGRKGAWRIACPPCALSCPHTSLVLC